MIRRAFVENRENAAGKRLLADLVSNLELGNLKRVRVLQRYDVEGLDSGEYEKIRDLVFREKPIEDVYDEEFPISDGQRAFAVEFLPGQFDQRADSAEQCSQIVLLKRPKIACARVFVLDGGVSDSDVERIKKYLINAVDSREASMDKPSTLAKAAKSPSDVASIAGFCKMDESALVELHKKMSLAMSVEDLSFCRDYFSKEEGRDPTVSEIRVLDTYWSDHCRHTTFLTELKGVEIEDSLLTKPISKAWEKYLVLRNELGLEKKGKKISLMDVALIGMRALRSEGKIPDLEESDEINAASIVVPVDVDGRVEEWLVMFKNETHNHPTEIEPFGGAATCLGGAIRDPLSGRSYVYQAMRVTGAGDPRKSFAETMEGKLPQRKIVTEAANGYSSYGNQIGLATGKVAEIYHEGYVAKRMEIGAVVAAAPRANVVRGVPKKGDFILLVGGRTGRDGIGGATGSSKDHTEHALENSAEVQKGDPPMERKLQRLFRNPEASRMIKRCNDFGAGGVSVAIGELAPSLEIDLDSVPKKYEGLDGTELAISESQERMAVVVSPEDAEKFSRFASEENLECTKVAEVTDSGRLVMKWRGKRVVDLSRAFLDTNGTTASAKAKIESPKSENPLTSSSKLDGGSLEAWKKNLSSLNCCSQRGLVERFDSSIGASAVLHPYGGKTHSTPEDAMCSKIPLLSGETDTGTLFSFGFNPYISSWSPFHGAECAVLESLARLAAAGGDVSKVRFTFQEYFEKLRGDPARWGKPLAALLGALDAQISLGLPSIGGKDSMSGSFNKIDVPPTLVSFAVAPCSVSKVISSEFKKPGSRVGVLRIEKTPELVPVWSDVLKKYKALFEAIQKGGVVSAKAVSFGGISEAVAKMCFGNSVGFRFESDFDLFSLDVGAIIVEVSDAFDMSEIGALPLGVTISEQRVEVGSSKMDLSELKEAWESPLESVFPTRARNGEFFGVEASYFPNEKRVGISLGAKPKVFIPVFPGTNCEYDSKRAFEKAGADVSTFVFRNMNSKDISDSISEMRRMIDESQILMIPGGFSAGDEPAGSGKFIAAVFRNPELSDAVMRLLKDRKGLILGICNGFQALIKLGLVPFGEIRPLSEDSPTLTYNNIARHVSCYVRTKVVSKLSPWFSDCDGIYSIPVSHGEGRFVASRSEVELLAKNGQIATQYVDDKGNPSAEIPFNPNGSVEAIEGITSPCGLVLGKMGHTERFGLNVGKNICGNKIQPIFSSGVKYFK